MHIDYQLHAKVNADALYTYGEPEAHYVLPEAVQRAVLKHFSDMKATDAQMPIKLVRPKTGLRKQVPIHAEYMMSDGMAAKRITLPSVDDAALTHSILYFEVDPDDTAQNVFVLYDGKDHANPKINRILGSGTQGRCKLIQNVATGAWYAVKISDLETVMDPAGLGRDTATVAQIEEYHEQMTRCIEREMSALHAVGREVHKITRGDKTYLLQPLFLGQEAFEEIIEAASRLDIDTEERNKRELESHVCIAYLTYINLIEGVLRDFTLLHENRLVHKDFKPENIIVSFMAFQTALIDFGFTAPIGGDIILCGSELWSHPDLMLAESERTTESVAFDYFGLGLLMASALGMDDTPNLLKDDEMLSAAERRFFYQFMLATVGIALPYADAEKESTHIKGVMTALNDIYSNRLAAVDATALDNMHYQYAAIKAYLKMREDFPSSDTHIPTRQMVDDMRSLLKRLATRIARGWAPSDKRLQDKMNMRPADIQHLRACQAGEMHIMQAKQHVHATLNMALHYLQAQYWDAAVERQQALTDIAAIRATVDTCQTLEALRGMLEAQVGKYDFLKLVLEDLVPEAPVKAVAQAAIAVGAVPPLQQSQREKDSRHGRTVSDNMAGPAVPPGP